MLLISAVLVLFMQAGFAALESDMGPQNNTVNITFKNFTDLCVGAFLFHLFGYTS
jgi:Amt family ammonium transporter